MRFTAPQNLLEPPIDLKIGFHLFKMVNGELLVYGQLLSALLAITLLVVDNNMYLCLWLWAELRNTQAPPEYICGKPYYFFSSKTTKRCMDILMNWHTSRSLNVAKFSTSPSYSCTELA